MAQLSAIILAAGKGTRMMSEIPKVLHPCAGAPLIYYSVDLAHQLKAKATAIVVAPDNRNEIKIAVDKYPYVNIIYPIQEVQLGTGHATQIAMSALKPSSGNILLLCGDMPLIRKTTLDRLIKTHEKTKADMTFLTAVLEEPGAYGRVVRTIKGQPSRIAEFEDASPAHRMIKEVNTGVYLFKAEFLQEGLAKIGKDNIQGEYYLTDLVHIAHEEGKKVVTVDVEDTTEGMGVNNQDELEIAHNFLYRKRIRKLRELGVQFVNPELVFIDSKTTVGKGTLVFGPSYLVGQSNVGKNCIIEPGVFIRNSQLKDEVHVKSFSYIDESRIDTKAKIGPFAHLRPGTDLGPETKVGNFVEIKKSKIRSGSKINHLSYIGDALIGKNVNIGAGTITCNYDGEHKHITQLDDEVFVGSDTQFVAPVKVGKGAIIGAGSTITKNVQPHSLALSRTKQTEVRNYRKRKNSGE